MIVKGVITPKYRGHLFGKHLLGSEDRNALSIVFQFVFIIIVGCQGLLIFLLHPCRSKDALNLWKKWFCGVTCMHHDEARKSSIQISRDQPTPQTFALVSFKVESSIREESIVKEESAMKEKLQFSPLPLSGDHLHNYAVDTRPVPASVNLALENR